MIQSTQSEVAGLLDQACLEGMSLVAALAPEERRSVGTGALLSAKDTLAHVGTWKERLAGSIKSGHWDQPQPAGDLDCVNRAISERVRNLSWQEVLALMREGFGALAGCVRDQEGVSVDQAPTAGRTGGRPLWKRFLGVGFMHPLMHLSQLRITRGQRGQALDIREMMYHALVPLDPSPSWRVELLYDLVCTCALVGQTRRAIALLGEALTLQPELVEWSRSDLELASIHSHPDLHTLYQVGEAQA